MGGGGQPGPLTSVLLLQLVHSCNDSMWCQFPFGLRIGSTGLAINSPILLKPCCLACSSGAVVRPHPVDWPLTTLAAPAAPAVPTVPAVQMKTETCGTLAYMPPELVQVRSFLPFTHFFCLSSTQLHGPLAAHQALAACRGLPTCLPS